MKKILIVLSIICIINFCSCKQNKTYKKPFVIIEETDGVKKMYLYTYVDANGNEATFLRKNEDYKIGDTIK